MHGSLSSGGATWDCRLDDAAYLPNCWKIVTSHNNNQKKKGKEKQGCFCSGLYLHVITRKLFVTPYWVETSYANSVVKKLLTRFVTLLGLRLLMPIMLSGNCS